MWVIFSSKEPTEILGTKVFSFLSKSSCIRLLIQVFTSHFRNSVRILSLIYKPQYLKKKKLHKDKPRKNELHIHFHQNSILIQFYKFQIRRLKPWYFPMWLLNQTMMLEMTYLKAQWIYPNFYLIFSFIFFWRLSNSSLLALVKGKFFIMNHS